MNYHLIVKDNDYIYVYNVTESGEYPKPVLTNSKNYFNVVNDYDPITFEIGFNNIFTNPLLSLNKFLPITITNVSILDTFRIDGNSLYSYSNGIDETYNINNLFPIDSPYYGTLNITASNGYETNTKELQFINIDYENPVIEGTLTPTSIIDFTSTSLTSSNIIVGESFQIIYPINTEQFVITDNTLLITNSNTALRYDILVQLHNKNAYIYRIQD
tara:strand:- start:118 stop:765 length:648 start_codon:yes stop_codon:yes gene_type:complete